MKCSLWLGNYNKILEIHQQEDLPQCIESECKHWKFKDDIGYCVAFKADWERGNPEVDAEFLRKCKE